MRFHSYLPLNNEGVFPFQVCRNKDNTISLKLADFGLAMDVKEPIYTVCGTPTYVAPEILAEIGQCQILIYFIGHLVVMWKRYKLPCHSLYTTVV